MINFAKRIGAALMPKKPPEPTIGFNEAFDIVKNGGTVEFDHLSNTFRINGDIMIRSIIGNDIYSINIEHLRDENFRKVNDSKG